MFSASIWKQGCLGLEMSEDLAIELGFQKGKHARRMTNVCGEDRCLW